MSRPSLHVLSNGHGEDDIACKIIDQLRALAPEAVQISAWAMVGTGQAYLRRGIPVEGPANLLPGEGFGTLALGSFARDLKAGFIATHWAQLRHAMALAGRHDLLLGVGDVVPLAAGWLAKTKMAFVACAKSAHYGGADGHTALERALMRRNCVEVFPRDPLTEAGFARHGVRARYLGNPMMDDLPRPAQSLLPDGTRGIALLPGSRKDAAENAALLLAASALILRDAPDLAVVMACPPGLAPAEVARAAIQAGPWTPGPAQGPDKVLLAHPTQGHALLTKGAFAAVLHSCQMAVGMAGTANEQAIGLGLPLIALAGAGNQGPAYLRMKQRYFGPAALSVESSAEAVASAVLALLADPRRCAAMAAAGRERMGLPGASAAIAGVVLDHLLRRVPT